MTGPRIHVDVHADHHIDTSPTPALSGIDAVVDLVDECATELDLTPMEFLALSDDHQQLTETLSGIITILETHLCLRCGQEPPRSSPGANEDRLVQAVLKYLLHVAVADGHLTHDLDELLHPDRLRNSAEHDPSIRPTLMRIAAVFDRARRLGRWTGVRQAFNAHWPALLIDDQPCAHQAATASDAAATGTV